MSAQDVFRSLPDVVLECAHPRSVGDAELLVAAAVEDGGAIAVRGHRELGGEAGLPDSRLARYERDAAAPLARLAEQEREPLALLAPADVSDRGDLAQARRERERPHRR